MLNHTRQTARVCCVSVKEKFRWANLVENSFGENNWAGLGYEAKVPQTPQGPPLNRGTQTH